MTEIRLKQCFYCATQDSPQRGSTTSLHIVTSHTNYIILGTLFYRYWPSGRRKERDKIRDRDNSGYVLALIGYNVKSDISKSKPIAGHSERGKEQTCVSFLHTLLPVLPQTLLCASALQEDPAWPEWAGKGN